VIAVASKIGVELSEVHAQTIKISDVTVGFAAGQVRELIEAATRGADEKVAEASRQLGVTQGAMRTMLATVGEADVPDERLAEKLTEVFEQTRKAAAAIDAVRPENAVAQHHVAKASEAAASGDRNEARRHLRAARVAAQAAAEKAGRLAQEAEAAAGQHMMQAARAVAAEAQLVLTVFHYAEAAGLFGEAASLVPDGEPREKGILLRRQADALQRQGEERGDNTALRRAITVYGRALELLPRERVPLDWATTQNDLGNALAKLGQRESGTARLKEAVTACRDAPQERTRERVPLDWAATQNDLGAALQPLGQRESGTFRLEEAVTAFRDALQERTRKRVPLAWAMTQNNLGNALATLGQRESGTARLEAAVTAYRDTLREWTRERGPLQWATVQNNLGNALSTLGQRETGTARLEEAVAAWTTALNSAHQFGQRSGPITSAHVGTKCGPR
jgi:tetratricopeptide (TPR) repeat protein